MKCINGDGRQAWSIADKRCQVCIRDGIYPKAAKPLPPPVDAEPVEVE
jgi:hypothetical protein